jgi:acetate---CoA ligase (ADP-forming)
MLPRPTLGEKMRLDALLRPKSVAVVGASEKPTIGRRLISSLDRLGFGGSIYPVNPGYRTVLGRRCYPGLAELPEAPDVVAFCLGHERVLDAFRAGAARGMRAAVIYDGGFAERGGEGARLQQEIARICRDHGIILCGPNCMGVLSPHDAASTYLQELREPAGLAGNVGVVSQSGSFCVSLVADIRRFGFSYICSSGNEAVLNAADYLEELADDPHTAIIACFIESVREPDRFAAALDRAAAAGKPVVLVKVGRQRRTAQFVATHTGGTAGDAAAISEILRAHRAIEVDDLVELCEVLAAFQARHLPRGRRIGAVTASGGIAELLLDVAAAARIELPPLPLTAQAALAAQIGFVTGDGNPLDAWGSGNYAANLPVALRLLAQSPDHDAVVFCRDNLGGQPFDTPEVARAYIDMVVAAASASDKPHYLLATRSGLFDPALAAPLRKAGVGVLGGIREGLGAIDRLARWAHSIGGE